MITFLMQIVLPFIKENWKAYVIGIAILAVYLYISFLQHSVASLEQQVTDLKGQIEICEENTKKLQSGLDAINYSLGEISKGMDETNKQFGDLNINILNSSNQLKGKMDKFLAADKKPIDCNSTIKYLIDAKKEYAQ